MSPKPQRMALDTTIITTINITIIPLFFLGGGGGGSLPCPDWCLLMLPDLTPPNKVPVPCQHTAPSRYPTLHSWKCPPCFAEFSWTKLATSPDTSSPMSRFGPSGHGEGRVGMHAKRFHLTQVDTRTKAMGSWREKKQQPYHRVVDWRGKYV